MSNEGMRLVLADDAPDLRALLRLTLGRAGYEIVGEAGDGAEAVALVQQLQPDAAVVDLAMPVMDGLEAIPLIRQQAPSTKVVAFSGFTGEQIEAEARAAGADAFMVKGAPPAQIVATLDRVLGGGAAAGAVDDAAPAPKERDSLSVVIHELMSPLTVIEGFAAMIEARAESLRPSEVRDYGTRIVRSAAHLRGLINAVADARRVEDGSLRLETELFDLGRVVSSLVPDLDAVTSPHPVSVDAAAGFVVHADVVRIRQVLTSLLSNAAKFSEPRLPIAVSVDAAGRDGWVELAVADQGPGVPVERRDRLFTRYARLGDGPGMGVGLFIARGIAQAHGGDLRLDDAAPGARFVVSLPLADA